MTVAEIHVKLGVALQKVNTHKSKNFLPQELDILFNFMLFNYKNKQTDLLSNPKHVSLFDTQTSLDSLSELFETLKLYPIGENIVHDERKFVLPFNFYGWISAVATVGYKCEENYKNDGEAIEYYEYYLANLNTIELSTGSTFDINISYQDQNGDEYDELLFGLSDLPPGYLFPDGYDLPPSPFVVINAILSIINNRLIHINEVMQYTTPLNHVSVKYDNNTGMLVLQSIRGIGLTVSGRDKEFEEKQWYSDYYTIYNPLYVPIAINDTEYNPYINNSRLSSSKLTELRGKRTRKELIIKLPESLVLSTIELTYIRIPRRIDYLLGIDSDLPDDIINKVITDTVQFTKGIIASDSYEKFVKENILIE